MAKPKRRPEREGAAEPILMSVSGGSMGNPLALDRVIHERLRLGIVSALAVNATLTFKELKEAMGATDGNLSAHARKLEEAGYMACTKSFVGRVPRTEYSLTDLGRDHFEEYLAHLEALIQAAKGPPVSDSGP